jgi:curved DNA binding protein
MASLADDNNSGSDNDEVLDLSNGAILDKYKCAAEIVNKTLQGVIDTQLKDGASVNAICKFGNAVIKAQCDATYKKNKKTEKGIAFPTCVSINHCVCHFSPLEAEDVLLKNGDVVKIDLGAHIDGCIAVVGHTLVVGGGNPTAPATEGETKVAATDGDKATGTYADVAMAAYKAGQLCLTMIVPGNTNTLLTETIAKVAEAYGVNAVQGVLMHNMKPFVIDGNKCIINKVEPDQNVDEIEFEPYEVYGIDIAMSTGKGKPIERDARTTVFKRAIEAKYALKMKASRYVLSEVDKLYPALPFATSLLTDIRQAKLGMKECVQHDLLQPYPVLWEKEGDYVAHVKFTVLVMPNGTQRITAPVVDIDATCSSDKSLPEDLEKILVDAAEAAALKKAKKKKKKKKKKKN